MPTKAPKSERVKERNRKQSRQNARMRAQLSNEAPNVRAKVLEKLNKNSKPMFTAMATRSAPVTSTGYIALNRPKGMKATAKDKAKTEEIPSLADLMALGFKYQKWEAG